MADMIAGSDPEGPSYVASKYYTTPFLDQNVGMYVVSGETLTPYYYTQDGLGSVRTLSNAAGTTVNSYDYQAFGETYTRKTSIAVSQRYTYTGREQNPATRTMSYSYWTYDSGIGRFVHRDPTGYTNNAWGNLYAYVYSAPVIWTDHFGLKMDYGPSGFLGKFYTEEDCKKQYCKDRSIDGPKLELLLKFLDPIKTLINDLNLPVNFIDIIERQIMDTLTNSVEGGITNYMLYQKDTEDDRKIGRYVEGESSTKNVEKAFRAFGAFAELATKKEIEVEINKALDKIKNPVGVLEDEAKEYAKEYTKEALNSVLKTEFSIESPEFADTIISIMSALPSNIEALKQFNSKFKGIPTDLLKNAAYSAADCMAGKLYEQVKGKGYIDCTFCEGLQYLDTGKAFTELEQMEPFVG